MTEETALRIATALERLVVVAEQTVERRRPRTRQQTASLFDFEPGYHAYPRKEGKLRGMQILEREIKTPEQLSAFERAVQHYAEHVRKNGVQPRYVMQFSTFANRWQEWAEGKPSTATPGRAGTRQYDFGGGT